MFGFDLDIDAYGEEPAPKRQRVDEKTAGDTEDATAGDKTSSGRPSSNEGENKDGAAASAGATKCRKCGGRKVDKTDTNGLDLDGNFGGKLLNFSAWVRQKFGEPNSRPQTGPGSAGAAGMKKPVVTASESQSHGHSGAAMGGTGSQSSSWGTGSGQGAAITGGNVSMSSPLNLPKAAAPPPEAPKTPRNQQKQPDQEKTSPSKPADVLEFHKASRLHFLGTWRERFERWTHSTGPGSLEGVVRSKSQSSNLWAYLDMDCFFAGVATRNWPEHVRDTTPAAVVSGLHPFSEVCSSNYAARRRGVPTTYVRYAKEVCPEIQLCSVTPELLAEVESTWKKVYILLLEQSPFVDMRSCDEAAVRVPKNVAESPGLRRTWADGLRKMVKERTGGVTCSIGIGASQIVARMGSKSAKPNGSLVIPERETQSFMSRIPLKDLPGVGRKLQQKLGEGGKFGGTMEMCGDLVKRGIRFARYEMGGKTGENLFYLASGVDPHLLPGNVWSAGGGQERQGKRAQEEYEGQNLDDELMRIRQQEILQNAINDASTNVYLRGGQPGQAGGGLREGSGGVGVGGEGDSAGLTNPSYKKRTMSSEMNWGVRPTSREDLTTLLANVANELEGRLKTAFGITSSNSGGCSGSASGPASTKPGTYRVSRLTLRLLVAGPTWVEPPKPGGHGPCDQLTKSANVGSAASGSGGGVSNALPRPLHALAVDDLFYGEIGTKGVDPTRVRGVGLTVNLEPLKPDEDQEAPDLRQQPRISDWL